MAITINQQPSGNMGANSPIIYQAYSPNYAQTGFYYQFKVYVWNGTSTIPSQPIATIERLPDQFGGGRGWIDIHQYVLQYLNQNYFNVGPYKPNINDGACRIAVKVNGIWNTGSDGIATSNVKLATLGWSYTMDGFNANFSGYAVLTDKQSIYITTNTQNYYIWFDATQVTQIAIGTYTTTPNTVTTSSNTLIQGIDLIQLMSAAGVSTDCVVAFTISGSVIEIPVYVRCVSRYGEVVAHFINKFGVYETMSFNAVSRKNIPFERETYQGAIYRQQDLSLYYGYGVPITTQFLANGKTNMMVNTNWIPQNYNTIIQQLLMSQNVLIDDNETITAARIIDNSFAEQKRVNEKLINYTLNFEYSQPLVNKIVR